MDLQDLLNNLPKLHIDPSSGKPISYSVHPAILHYIDKNADGNSKTLETGAGVSTILFALKGTNHTCIFPYRDEFDRITTYCKQNQISIQRINFQIDASENVLPRLELDGLDLVLIDGRHAFPTPFIDWFYASRGLKVGGKLIIDDTNLWTGNMLKEFLLLEPEWKMIKEVSQRSAVFVKLKDGGYSKCWNQQPFVTLNSNIPHRYIKMPQTIGLLFRGRFLTLIKKIFYRVKFFYHFGWRK